MVDETKLNAFIGKILGDLGGAFSAPLVRMGDKLGLYKALKEQGPMTPAELAAKTNVAERYAREWLSHQAASGYLEYDAATGKFTLPPEQAMVFAEPDSPVYLQPAFDMAAVMLENQPLVEACVPLGQGRRLGQSVAVPVLHDRTLLPPRLSKQSCRFVAAGLGRRRRETRKRREGGRRWLRSRLFDHHHGESVPEIDFRRLRLSPRRRWRRRGFMPSSTEQPRT